MRGPLIDPSVSIAKNAKSVEIDISGGAGDNTIWTVDAGKIFHVYYLFIHSAGTETVMFKSGSTDLSGAIPFAANGELVAGGHLIPILKGRAQGENFVIATSVGSVALDGWALITEAER